MSRQGSFTNIHRQRRFGICSVAVLAIIEAQMAPISAQEPITSDDVDTEVEWYENPCRPQNDEASFFEHAEYRGRCVKHSFGRYRTQSDVQVVGLGVSSVWLGSNAEAVLCAEEVFEGKCTYLTSSSTNLTDSDVGNDTLVSAAIFPKGSIQCVPIGEEVALFEHAVFEAPCVVLRPGRYVDADQIGLADNSISSYILASSRENLSPVTLCRGKNFDPRCENVTALADPSLVDNEVGNDKISSVNIPQPGACEAWPLLPVWGNQSEGERSVVGGASWYDCPDLKKVTVKLMQNNACLWVDRKIASAAAPSPIEATASFSVPAECKGRGEAGVYTKVIFEFENGLKAIRQSSKFNTQLCSFEGCF